MKQRDKKTNFSNEIPLDTYYTPEVDLPQTDDYSFSWRRLWAFTGPGFLMSIAYLDPGNIESDMQAGTIAYYKLLWVLLYSTVLGLLMQILSTRLGVVSGQHLAEMCYKRYPKVPRLLLWIMTEIAIIGSDIQEVIGTALALYMLTNRWLPLWAGVLVTILDTFSFLFLDKYGLRKLEAVFAFLITTMAVTFGYEFFRSKPEADKIGLGLAVPYCKDCDNDALLQGVGIIGAIIMPHNLYLHSALVKSRKVDNSKHLEVKDANRYILIESAIALFVSFLINLSVTSVFAHGLHGKTNSDVYQICKNHTDKVYIDWSVLSDDNETFTSDLYQAGIFLGCQFDGWAYYVWAIGILAAGQSSTMTGTYAGQFAMEGFLNLQWPRWKRVLLTRSLAIMPTLAVTVFSDVQSLTGMNDYLNALMVLQLPFAVLPTLTFSSSKLVMGRFKNNLFSLIVATLLSIVVVVINVYSVIQTLMEFPSTYHPIMFPMAAFFGTLYIVFILFLIGCFMSVLDIEFHHRIPGFGKHFPEPSAYEYKYID